MPRKRPTDDGDELLVRLGSLTAQARRRAELQRSQVELAVALQRGMLPRDLPAAPGLHLAVRYAPANHGLNVGGDWYDAFTLPDGRIGLTIGDVQGHNIEAAAFMGQVRAGLRALASVTGEPGELLGRTNDLLLSLGGELFATCTFMRLDPATGVLESARAGHIPFVWATADGKSGVVDDEGGPPLGIDRGMRYPVTRHRFADGGLLVLLTDGVVEGPSLSVDEGLAQVVRLAGIAAVAGLVVVLDAGRPGQAPGLQRGHGPDRAAAVRGHHRAAPHPALRGTGLPGTGGGPGTPHHGRAPALSPASRRPPAPRRRSVTRYARGPDRGRPGWPAPPLLTCPARRRPVRRGRRVRCPPGCGWPAGAPCPYRPAGRRAVVGEPVPGGIHTIMLRRTLSHTPVPPLHTRATW